MIECAQILYESFKAAEAPLILPKEINFYSVTVTYAVSCMESQHK